MTAISTKQVPPIKGHNLIEELLAQQQQLTAVEKFSQYHESATAPLLESHYRDLIPASPPGPGQQYAFEVSLDDCSGCKACVTACHNLNGLEEEEVWRSVGLLHGGSSSAPMQQHVTAACHHCVEPGCLKGCPVKAYDKDPLTGIVVHLDDQCIGCQYCMLMCPYEVPQYSESKGIVRKCDMCSERLSAGEAPACVQSCPHEAIRIATIEVDTIARESEADNFLPGSPDPAITLPTTRYNSSKKYPRNTLPADYFAPRAQHAHWPLIVMLVLTQMSIGAFVVNLLLSMLQTAAPSPAIWQAVPVFAAFGIGMLGMSAAIFHLGRPVYAFRALLGLRTSWMSREILAFNLFAAAATGYCVTALAPLMQWNVPSRLAMVCGGATCVAGVLSVFCSAMIYVATRKQFWAMNQTGIKFSQTALVLGLSTIMVVQLLAMRAGVASPWLALLLGATMAATAVKMLWEAATFGHLCDRTHTQLRRSALLMIGPLRGATIVRFALGLFGGLLLPLILLTSLSQGVETTHVVLAITSLLMLLVGEIAERYLFFRAVSAARMPGGPAQ